MASYNPNNLSPDELSCPICFEEFCDQSSSEHAPKLLLCLHTFCLGCIRNLVRSNKSIQCSICRTEHTDVSPQELFDNYVIMEYVRKQQEESDARLARKHSEHLSRDQPDQPGYQQRQEQLMRDAELARQYQQYYDTVGNDDDAAPRSCSTISDPTVSVVQRPENLCSAPDSTVSVVQRPEEMRKTSASSNPALVASCSRPCRPPPPAPSFGISRSASNSASSSSPSTSSIVTISSDASSDDRCSSSESSSSRLEEEFVDTVETLEMDSSGIVGAAAVAADDSAEEGEIADVIDASNSSCTGSALSPAYTDNSGFSYHDEDSQHGVEVNHYNEEEEVEDDDHNSDSSHHEDDSDSNIDDRESLHLGETFSEHIEDNLGADDDLGMDDQLSDADEENQEDELFNNFSVLETIDPSPEGPAGTNGSHDVLSTDESCISISDTESDSGLTPKDPHLSGQFNPIRRNFPLYVHSDLSDGDTLEVDDPTLNSDNMDEDGENNDTITLEDSEDSSSNAANKTYNIRPRSDNVTTIGKDGSVNA